MGLESRSKWIRRFGKSFKYSPHNGVLGSRFSSRKKVLDPVGSFLQRWNRIFVLSCLLALSLDLLFLYVPVIDNDKKCLSVDRKMETTATVLRSFFDIFYIIHIIFQFRTGFLAPSARVVGRGALVEDTRAIAMRYLSSYFLIDILAVLPLPQVAVLIIIPKMRGCESLNTKNLLKFIVFFQYLPRLLRIIPLYRTSGILTENPWRGAAFNFSIYIIAGHVIGVLWYLFSIERETTCWQDACQRNIRCNKAYLYCDDHQVSGIISTLLEASCPIQDPNITLFNFGIFLDALQSGVVESTNFPQKFFYCIWWGIRSLRSWIPYCSSLGQNLATSASVWENCFAIFISISGLVFYVTIIGNMLQTVMQSVATRLEEMRVKRRDTEEWMLRRALPCDLKERIRRHQQYKWRKTKGVDEDNLISELPIDIRRDVKRHLCLSMLRRVPLFEQMDEQLLDVMCDRLKLVLYTENSYIAREGDPVDEMLFIMGGRLLSATTNGGRKGFFSSSFLKDWDFCGEELLTWALDPHSSSRLPISTRTLRTLTEVEAFSLNADDLKFVASQFRGLIHSAQLQHIFRFYSLNWRTWAASFIQAAWRRYSRKKLKECLREEENRLHGALAKAGGSSPSLGATIYASRFAVNALRTSRRHGTGKTKVPERVSPMLLWQKPAEPDFTAEEPWMPGFTRN